MELDLNLGEMQETIESIMMDEITIHRDPELTADDAWDPDTGTYTTAPGDDKLLYAGKAYVAPLQTFPRKEDIAGQETNRSWYWVSIPMDAGYQPQAEDLVTVVSSRDPVLVNRRFFVEVAEASTFAISRRIRVYHRTPVP